MKKSIVASVPIDKDYRQAFNHVIQCFPSISRKIKTSKKIFIKICIDHVYQYLHTNLELLHFTLKYIRQINPSCKIFVMENNIHGSFTRLTANVTNITQLIKQNKAKFIYLDEKKPTSISIGNKKERYRVEFPQILVEQLISDRQNSFYLNIANLKTHFQTKIAGGIFNQIGLILLQSHRFIYSHFLNQTIVDLLTYIQPDFTIIDANVAIGHGSLPPESLIDRYAATVNRLVGGIDPVAVDRVALELINYSPSKVEHIKLAIKRELGEGDLNHIEIKGNLISKPQTISYMFELSQLPQKMDIIFGKNRTGIETCMGVALQYAQIVFRDFAGNDRFTLITGTEFSDEQLEKLCEPIVVLGLNTCKEVASYIKTRYQNVYYLYYCDDIRQIMAVIAKVLGTSVYNLLGVNPLTVWKHLFIGKLNGLKYQVPYVDGKTKTWKTPPNSTNKKNRK